jgi:hypothetical protein
MASGKKRRKAANQTRKAKRSPAAPFRHPDGDRRRRGGMTYEQGMAQKRLLQQPPAQEEE